VAVSTDDEVRSLAAAEIVVASTTEDAVVAHAQGDVVVAAEGADDVVAAVAGDRVLALGAQDHVLAGGADDDAGAGDGRFPAVTGEAAQGLRVAWVGERDGGEQGEGRTERGEQTGVHGWFLRWWFDWSRSSPARRRWP